MSKKEIDQWKLHIDCFRLSKGDEKAFKKWNKEHLQKKHKSKEPYGGAVGGRISYIFTPTSIGTFASVRCNAPGCKDDVCVLTDTSDF